MQCGFQCFSFLGVASNFSIHIFSLLKNEKTVGKIFGRVTNSGNSDFELILNPFLFLNADFRYLPVPDLSLGYKQRKQPALFLKLMSGSCNEKNHQGIIR